MAGSSSGEATYSPTARRFHWWTVLLVVIQIPLGLYMSYRGNVQGIFDDLNRDLLNETLKATALIRIFQCQVRRWVGR